MSAAELKTSEDARRELNGLVNMLKGQLAEASGLAGALDNVVTMQPGWARDFFRVTYPLGFSGLQIAKQIIEVRDRMRELIEKERKAAEKAAMLKADREARAAAKKMEKKVVAQ